MFIQNEGQSEKDLHSVDVKFGQYSPFAKRDDNNFKNKGLAPLPKNSVLKSQPAQDTFVKQGNLSFGLSFERI